ncbi:MFS transporter [Amycolatopsis balhimycina]|uniref:MFS transporter n=1 Tax=Amycolatopsis balhimycina TaxID=208443 RepID=UPI0003A25840|nr:MFS transporter [Amycolatopsis balhimycina]
MTGSATAVRGDFSRLWLATAISAFGDGVRYTAIPLLALSFTTDPFRLALVTVAMAVPLLFSALAGVLADMVDRRRLLIGVDLARAAVVTVLALLVLTGTANLALVCVAAALLGLGEAVFAVGAQSFLPEVVPPARLTAANGRLHVAQLVFRDSIGQSAGGVVFVLFAALPFLLDGGSFALGVLLLLAVRRTAAPAPEPASGPGPRVSWRAMLAEGVRYLKADRLLTTLAVMLGMANFFVTGIAAVEVLYVVQELGLPKAVFGVFLAAAALGGIAGALLSGRLAARLGVFRAALASLASAGLAVMLLGLAAWPPTAVAGFAVFGFGTAVYQTLTVSFRQADVPAELLGRVNGVYRLIGTGTAPLGALAAGALAGAQGLRSPFLAAGAGILLLALVAARPVLRMAAGRVGTA